MGNTRQYESQHDGHQKGSFRPERIPDCQQPVITALLGHVAGLLVATGSESNLLFSRIRAVLCASQVVIKIGKSGRLCRFPLLSACRYVLHSVPSILPGFITILRSA